MALYKAETLEKMGEIYHKLLWIRNKETEMTLILEHLTYSHSNTL